MTFKPGNQVAAIAARRRADRAVRPAQKGRYITAKLIEKLDELIEHNGKSGRAFEHLIEGMIRDALAGDSKLAAYLIERIEGKNPQEISVSHTHDINLDALSDEQLLQLKEIVKAQSAEVVDAEFVEVSDGESSDTDKN